jgi:dolichol-phosphate mannosyltransferase
MRKAVVVLPTFNEKESIKDLIENIFRQQKSLPNWTLEVLVVDSQSPDGTGKIIKSLQKTYKEKLHLLETEKEGLGKAYTRGFTYAMENLKPYVLFEMDADLSHDPKEIPNFLKSVEKGADFVVGSRYIKGGSIPANWGFHRKLFSMIGNLIVKLGFMKPQVQDWTSGYRAIKVWLINSSLEKVKKYTGYVFQIALLDQALKKNAHLVEIPIQFTDRRYGKSKIIFGEYIFQILWYILCYSSFIKYVIVGIIGFLIDFGLSFLFIEKVHLAVWLATIISAESAIISNFYWNNSWSFAHKKLEGGWLTYLPQFLKFNLVSVGAIAIQAIGIQISVNILGKKFWYLYKALIIIFIVIPYSYILYNKVIWKDK